MLTCLLLDQVNVPDGSMLAMKKTSIHGAAQQLLLRQSLTLRLHSKTLDQRRKVILTGLEMAGMYLQEMQDVKAVQIALLMLHMTCQGSGNACQILWTESRQVATLLLLVPLKRYTITAYKFT